MTTPPKLDLAALTARVKARVATEEAAKVAKVAAKRDPSKAAEAYVLQNAADWNTTALVIVYDDWECACGNHGSSPRGLFLLQEHSRMANCSRLEAIGSGTPPPHLPKKWFGESRIVALCHQCAPAVGFLKEYRRPPPPAHSALASFLTQAHQAGRVMQPHEEAPDGDDDGG